MMDSLVERAEGELRDMRVPEALQLFNDAETASSQLDACAAGRWQCYMLLGDFERAWCESDLISRRGHPDPNRFWDGRPLDCHRVLIRCLHGLGDTIQFIRYAPLVRAVARSVIIEAQPKLKALLSQSGLADQVITWSEPEPPWDRQVEVIELPRVFRTTLDTIPAHVPYLHDGAASTDILSSHPASFRVGIAWNSSTFNPARSIAVEKMAPMFKLPGVTFFGLQAGSEHTELSPWSSIVTDLYDRVSTIHDTARILKSLHLVITVDTMTAHLAGALAVPVWTMLPHQCDWRWMLQRTDSPWYPTMRLFRQPEPGNWSAVVDQVVQALASVTQSRQNGKGCYSGVTPGIVK
ncbi:MAG: hypothetical protein JO051_00990 [Acidobacteriaceae bacterium]|nr:hypothetical protein [Acidobacteriaceae bacterium]